jgi:TnpA family transposase
VPASFLSAAERERLNNFPPAIGELDLATHFTLTAEDRALIEQRRRPANRLGIALQLCTLRHIGFVPDDLRRAPHAALAMLATQLRIAVNAIDEYAEREQTRTDHLQEAMAALSFRAAGAQDLEQLEAWLVERALEHDRPTLLLQLAGDWLRRERVVRPGVTVLERLVGSAWERAEVESRQRLGHLLDQPARMRALDGLLLVEPEVGGTRLAWLRTGATASTSKAILGQLAKLSFLQGLGAGGWDLAALPPNRRRFLAQWARRSTNQALQRWAPERRHPALLAFCADTAAELTDEVVELFDRALASTDARARRELDELRKRVARATNEKVRLFIQLGRILLEPETEADAKLRQVEQRIGLERLRRAVEDAERLARPEDDSYFDLLASRYAYLREFTPALLRALDLKATPGGADLMEAVEQLRELNGGRRRRGPHVPEAAIGFVPNRWHPYVVQEDGRVSRRYWELCVLSELRGALRSGDVWVAGSRRHADPETYLIPRSTWPDRRDEVSKLVDRPLDPEERLRVCEAELDERLDALDRTLSAGGGVRIEDGGLVVRPLIAEDVPDGVRSRCRQLEERLPHVHLTDQLIEVDGWCGWSRHLTHAGGANSRGRDLAVALYAAVLAQACNLGLTRMAEVSDLTYRQLAWATEWYLREETLNTASAEVVNDHHGRWLAQAWGGGTLSSSDGQRFPVAVRSATAAALPRYFGPGRGITAYTHVSDQHTAYATKVIVATDRDATYVLDGWLDNETELPIVEHTADTAGYTELVFALCDLVGLQFSPRIRDIGDQRLYRMGRASGRRPVDQLLTGTIDRRLIAEHWDDLIRVGGSIKMGWVTASLLISRLQAAKRKSTLTRALQEYGRLQKTLFILRYLQSEEYRRRINRQLNKGESLHALRRRIFFADEGKVRRRHHEEQVNQATCLTLVTNAAVLWNTVYLQAAIEQLRREGVEVDDEVLVHLSPALYEHINPYGRFHFDVDAGLGRKELRPLRNPPQVA